MADDEGKLIKVRAGFYRCGKFCIHRGSHGWGVFVGPELKLNFLSLKAAHRWARGAN